LYLSSLKICAKFTQRIGFSKSWRNTLVMLSLFNVNKIDRMHFHALTSEVPRSLFWCF
jgi:hypothetical protein